MTTFIRLLDVSIDEKPEQLLEAIRRQLEDKGIELQ